MTSIIIDKLKKAECKKYDIINIVKDNKLLKNTYVVLNNQEYIDIEKLCFYLYEQSSKPKKYKLQDDMILYKIGEANKEKITMYEQKIDGDING